MRSSLAVAIRGVLVTSVVSIGASRAWAADAPANTFTLGEVEVIGSRESEITPLVVEKILAEEMAKLHRDDLAEALELAPGVNLQNLGQRRERLIYVRGFTSRQVPLFIDGVPVYVPYDGNVDLARFGVDYVSEVSVSKGLASLLYGPNILGGAINVISRKPTKPLEASARVAVEVDDHFGSADQRVVGSLGGTGEMFYGHVTASYVNSDGYRLPSDFMPVAAEDGGERENAASRDTVVSAKVGFAPNEHHEFALSYYRQDGEKDDPPYAGSYLRVGANPPDGVQVRYWQWPYWDKESLYFVARDDIGSKGTLRWRLFYDTFKNSLESYDDATYTTQVRPYAFHGSHYDDYTYGANVDFEWGWTDTQITRLAAHYRHDVHREAQITPYRPDQRLQADIYDLAIEHESRITSDLTIAASYSHMIQPGETVDIYNPNTLTFSPVSTNSDSADNAQLVGTYSLTETQSLVAGVSQKTRFPTLKDRFSGGLGTVVPNPDLESETALHYEIGYQLSTSMFSVKAAVFHSETDDAIQSVAMPASSCASPPCTQLQNIDGGQRHQGIELSAGYFPTANLRLNAQANFLDVVNKGSTVLPTGIPKRKFLVNGDWEFVSNWRLRADAQYESERVSNSTGTRVADSFTLLNMFVRFTPIESLGFELGVRNATDELYAYEEGYFEAGRMYLGQVDYRF